jgi:hypothetical protein
MLAAGPFIGSAGASVSWLLAPDFCCRDERSRNLIDKEGRPDLSRRKSTKAAMIGGASRPQRNSDSCGCQYSGNCQYAGPTRSVPEKRRPFHHSTYSSTWRSLATRTRLESYLHIPGAFELMPGRIVLGQSGVIVPVKIDVKEKTNHVTEITD